MKKRDWILLQAYKAIGLSPEQVLQLQKERDAAVEARAAIAAKLREEMHRQDEFCTRLQSRLVHLLQSDFIKSFDAVDRKTGKYVRDIREADNLVASIAGTPTPLDSENNFELRACPFCGGRAQVLKFSVIFGAKHPSAFCVTCTRCGVETARYYRAAREAVVVWNGGIQQ